MDEDEIRGNRFGYLLQPIRDLAQNWDVDIAKELDQYVTELEELGITFEDGKPRLNFAEAALLIQGSVCVYSRKVEYLYQLVYEVLELLANKRKAKESKEGANGDGEGGGEMEGGGGEEF